MKDSFLTREQTQEETSGQYIVRLRQFSDSCDFGSMRDETIRDRLVIGCKDNGVKYAARTTTLNKKAWIYAEQTNRRRSNLKI